MGYFGNAGDAGRWTKDQMTPANAVKAKKAGHNRIVWENDRGFRHYRLIQTDVVSISPDGRELMIDTAGYDSKTTASAILSGVSEFGYKGPADGKWHIANVAMRCKSRPTNELILLRRKRADENTQAERDAPEYRAWERKDMKFDQRIFAYRDYAGEMTFKSDLEN